MPVLGRLGLSGFNRRGSVRRSCTMPLFQQMFDRKGTFASNDVLRRTSPKSIKGPKIVTLGALFRRFRQHRRSFVAPSVYARDRSNRLFVKFVEQGMLLFVNFAKSTLFRTFRSPKACFRPKSIGAQNRPKGEMQLCKIEIAKSRK